MKTLRCLLLLVATLGLYSCGKPTPTEAGASFDSVHVDHAKLLLSCADFGFLIYWNDNSHYPGGNRITNLKSTEEDAITLHELPEDFLGAKAIRLVDPFTGDQFRFFRLRKHWDYMLVSPGPDGVWDISVDDVVIERDAYLAVSNVALLYDPTNGLCSSGDIILSSQIRYAYTRPVSDSTLAAMFPDD